MVLVQTAPTAPHSLGEWCVVHGNLVKTMSEIAAISTKRGRTGGRQKGTPNRVTADIRRALRDVAEGNAHRVQEWLDRVAETDPAKAMDLWLALLRFVTPTLQAAAIADITPPKRTSEQLLRLSDEELLERIVHSQKAAELARQGVNSKDELLLRMAELVTVPALTVEPAADDEELLR
jgi:hypothetical protein